MPFILVAAALMTATARAGDTGQRTDCNTNGQSDELDIRQADGGSCAVTFVCSTQPNSPGCCSFDCNRNAVPDECESLGAGPVLFVNQLAVGANTGASWANAFTDLQSAICVASHTPSVTGIWVARGTYKPDRGTGDRGASFQMLNGVTIVGGLAGNEDPNTYNLANRNFVLNETVLTGDLLGDDVGFANNSENSRHIVTASNVDLSAIIDGFTIRNGNASGVGPPDPASCWGAGVLNISGTPSIRNSILTNNYAGCTGAGLDNFLVCSVASLTNCTFLNNAAHDGATELIADVAQISMAGGAISGPGSVFVAGPTDVQYISAIRGFGLIESTITNRGHIEANIAGQHLTLSGPTMLNESTGEFRAAQDGILSVLKSVSGSGKFNADAGTIEVVPTAINTTVTGSALTVTGNNGFIDIDGAVAGLHVTITGSATVTSGPGACPPLLRGSTPPVLQVRRTAIVEVADINIPTAGALQLGNTATFNVSGAVNLDCGGVCEGLASSAATTSCATLTVQSSSDVGGQLLLSSDMLFSVSSDATFAGCSSLEVCSPPILQSIGQASLTIGGNLTFDGVVRVLITSSNPVILSGNLNNHATVPALFDWDAGRLRMASGAPPVRHFEMAGRPHGVHPLGFINNFAMNELRIEPGVTVDFEDTFDNSPGAGCEVLYVDTLSVGAGSVVRLHGCNVYYRTLINEGGSINASLGGAVICMTRGDLNCDGQINAADRALFVAVLLGTQSADQYVGASDLSGDGIVNATDIQAFVNAELGL